ncbi:transcriptional regulator [Natrinema sp. CBA1119]|nr:transcriptional regulator [Natrinema sp. CBA1119]
MRRDRVREDSVFGRRERVHGTIVRRNLPAVDRQLTSLDRILDGAHRCETNVHPELVRQGLPNGKQHRYVATDRTTSRSAGANYRSTGRETPPEEHMIDATENSLAILEAVHQNDRAGVTALADETGLAKSTVHSHVETLKRSGYLVQSGDDLELSLRFLQFGLDTRRREPHRIAAREKVVELARRTGERAHYVVREGTNAVFLYSETGENAVRTGVHTGDFVPLHATASGKAILANLPPERIEMIVSESDRRQVTPNTITDLDALREALRNVRSRGLAFNDGEYVERLWSVGAPVFDDEKRVLGSMSVSVPANRLGRPGVKDELSTTLLETVNELELEIAHA